MSKSEQRPADFDPLTSKNVMAEELGINLSTLWRWEKEGHVPRSVKIGGRVGWPRSVVRKWKVEQGWPVASQDGNEVIGLQTVIGELLHECRNGEHPTITEDMFFKIKSAMTKEEG